MNKREGGKSYLSHRRRDICHQVHKQLLDIPVKDVCQIHFNPIQGLQMVVAGAIPPTEGVVRREETARRHDMMKYINHTHAHARKHTHKHKRTNAQKTHTYTYTYLYKHTNTHT